MNEKNVEVKMNENDIVPAQVIKVNNKTITTLWLVWFSRRISIFVKTVKITNSNFFQDKYRIKILLFIIERSFFI